MKLKSALIIAGWSLAACAGAKQESRGDKEAFALSEPVAPAAPAARAPRTFNAREFQTLYPQPKACLQGAEQLQAEGKELGWAAMKHCVMRSDFTLLRQVLADNWIEEWKARPEAGALFTRLIANRGGAIANDVGLLQEKEIPFFPLGAALQQPNVYKGRYVIFRAKAGELKSDGGKPTVLFAELGVASEKYDVQKGDAFISSRSSSGSASGSYKTSNFGKGQAEVRYDSSSTNKSGRYEQRFNNVVEETGRQVLARLQKEDPFLQPEKELILLGRFDGTRVTSDGDEKQTIAVVTLVSYHAPAPLMVY